MKIVTALLLICSTLLAGCGTTIVIPGRNTDGVYACRDAYYAQKRSLEQEREIAAAELKRMTEGDWYQNPRHTQLPSAAAASTRTSQLRNLDYRIKALNQQLADLASRHARGSCDGINIYSGYSYY